MEDLTGKQLNQYRVLGPLGEGGMAAVYKAYQANMDRDVAIKILPRQYAAEPGFLARFEREAKVIAGLEHPHIIPVHDYGQADGYTYLVMRLVQGGTLAERLGKAPLRPAEIVHIVGQIASALDYAHGRGVIHRDIKPSNVLLDPQDNCLLTDFGIAKMVSGATQLTASGAFLGTPRYASPEQGMGRELTGRSDVYSLGVILYEMATGRAPFEAETPLALIFKHANDPLPPPRTLNPSVPAPVEQAILKALAKDPDHRFASAGELARAVAAGYRGAGMETGVRGLGMDAGGAGVEAGATAATAEARRPRRFPLRWAAFVALGGVLLLSVGAAAVLLISSLRDRIEPRILLATQPGEPTVTPVPTEQAPPAPPTTPPRLVINRGNAASLFEQQLLTRGTVNTLAIDGAAGWLAAGGGMGAWIYELDSMQPLRLLDHGAIVAGVAFSPNGQTLATAGFDGLVRIWDVTTGEELAAMAGHTGSLTAVAWSSNGGRLVSAAYDGTLRVWQASVWQPAGAIQDLTQGTIALTWIPGTSRFASGSLDGTVRIWDADRRVMQTLLGSHQGSVQALAASADGQRLASADDDDIFVWDLNTGDRLHDMSVSGFHTVGLAWSGDGELLAEANVIGYLGELAIWDVEQEETVERLDDLFLDALTALSWDAESDRLAVATRRGMLALWDSDTGQLLHDSRPHADSATGLAWSPDGGQLATTTSEGRLQVWDRESGQERNWTILEAVGIDIGWSPDGAALAVASSGGSAHLLDAGDLSELDELRSGEEFAYAVAWSPDGSQLALGAESGTLAIWDPTTGRKLATLEGHTDFVGDAAWSPDGTRLASVSNDGSLRLWHAATAGLLDVFDIGATGNAVEWSPDEQAIAVGTQDGRMLIWPIGADGASFEATLGAGVGAVDWSPNGEVLAAATDAGELWLYQSATGSLIFQGDAHNGPVRGLRFSPDGSQLATAGADGAIKLWGVR